MRQSPCQRQWVVFYLMIVDGVAGVCSGVTSSVLGHPCVTTALVGTLGQQRSGVFTPVSHSSIHSALEGDTYHHDSVNRKIFHWLQENYFSDKIYALEEQSVNNGNASTKKLIPWRPSTLAKSCNSVIRCLKWQLWYYCWSQHASYLNHMVLVSFWQYIHSVGQDRGVISL